MKVRMAQGKIFVTEVGQAERQVSMADYIALNTAENDRLASERDAALQAAARPAKASSVRTTLNALGTFKEWEGEQKPCKGNIQISGVTSAKFPLSAYAAQFPRIAAEFVNVAGIILDPANQGKIAYRNDVEQTQAETWAKTLVAPQATVVEPTAVATE